MTVFVVKWKGYICDSPISGIDSVFSTAGLAMLRCKEMVRVRPDLDWEWEKHNVDDLIKE